MQTSSLMTLVGLSSAVFLASVIIALGSVSEDAQCNEGPDSTSLMQGIVHVEKMLTAKQNAKSLASVPSEAKREDDVSVLLSPGVAKSDDPPIAVKASLSPPASTSSEEISQPITSPNTSLITTHSHVFAAFSHATSSLSGLAGTLKTRAGAGSVLLVLLLVFCVVAAAMVIIPAGLKRSNAQTAQQRPPEASYSSGFPRATASGVPSVFNLPQHSASNLRMSQRPGDFPLGLSPAGTGLMPQMSPQAPQFSKQVPPPLCPTLVMPVCEARFGVPMTEIAALGTEGAISIVGLSGNPLLRAVIKLDNQQQRTLEICMPEKNSAPRATVAPSRLGLLTQGYDIRGMKGVLYGFLEIENCGSCHVIKDGQTVLVLDGDTDNLQLSIKSGLGPPLASVRCSAEPFGGVDHVEIRVEPGVDTVLVLAVVLGVLVLAER